MLKDNLDNLSRDFFIEKLIESSRSRNIICFYILQNEIDSDLRGEKAHMQIKKRAGELKA
jgi:hypothetical protein